MSTNVPQIQVGLGNRVGSFVRDCVLFGGSLVMAYIKGWKLALVASAMIPLIAISFGILGFSLNHFNKEGIKAYSHAGGIANEVLSSIRTVYAYGAQEITHKRYTEQLHKAERTGIKKGMALGAGEFQHRKFNKDRVKLMFFSNHFSKRICQFVNFLCSCSLFGIWHLFVPNRIF